MSHEPEKVSARPPTERDPSWILRSGNTYQGRPLWFKQMTGIGPMTTAKKAEAARFTTKEEALLSPPNRFALMSWTAVKA